MKKYIFLFIMIGLSVNLLAQSNQTIDITQKNLVYESSLPVIYITKDVNLMFRSPEPVQFVDLSSDKLIGDLPSNNIVRLKLSKYKEEESILDSIPITEKKEIIYLNNENVGVISIVGQSFMAQYKLVYVPKIGGDHGSINGNVLTNIQIIQKDMQPLEYPSISMSDLELKKYSLNIIKNGKNKKLRKNKEFNMGASLNNIYAYDDYIFLDVLFTNTSNLVYDIGNVEFSIDDKKIFKATNNQSISLTPVFQLYENTKFRNQFRNIYVFKKFTFPNDKMLNIRIFEKGISGRTLITAVKYSDLLDADTF